MRGRWGESSDQRGHAFGVSVEDIFEGIEGCDVGIVLDAGPLDRILTVLLLDSGFDEVLELHRIILQNVFYRVSIRRVWGQSAPCKMAWDFNRDNGARTLQIR